MADLLEQLKKASNGWMQADPMREVFSWQKGYGSFSVSEHDKERVIAYIENQSKHHNKVDFKDELRRLLAEHGLAYDEKYIWT